jgi:hypothetical protein
LTAPSRLQARAHNSSFRHENSFALEALSDSPRREQPSFRSSVPQFSEQRCHIKVSDIRHLALYRNLSVSDRLLSRSARIMSDIQ